MSDFEGSGANSRRTLVPIKNGCGGGLAKPFVSLPLYRDRVAGKVTDFPVQGKAEFSRDFGVINTRGIGFDDAMEVAQEAENSRDFTPPLTV